MIPEFICPCCGHEFTNHERLFKLIITEVAKYYEIPAENITEIVEPHGLQNRARLMCVYFMRVMTGESFKVICNEVGYKKDTSAGASYRLVKQYLESKSCYQIDCRNLKKIILKKINSSGVLYNPKEEDIFVH